MPMFFLSSTNSFLGDGVWKINLIQHANFLHMSNVLFGMGSGLTFENDSICRFVHLFTYCFVGERGWSFLKTQTQYVNFVHIHTYSMYCLVREWRGWNCCFQRINLPACRRVLWVLLVRSCTVCFVFVFVYTFPLARIFASSNLNPPAFFVSSSSFLTFWWAQLCTRLAQHRLGFANLAVISMVVSVFLLRLPSVCSVASYIQYLIHWPLCRAPFTRVFSKYGLFQNPGLHTCFGLNLNRGFNKANVFSSRPSFTQRAVLHKTVSSTNTMFYTKNIFLLGLCKGYLQLSG